VIKIWFLAMKRMSSIGGCVGALLMFVISASDGYCFSKANKAPSRSVPISTGIPARQISKNNLTKPARGNQIVGNAIQKTLQSQPVQQLLQVGQDHLVQQANKLTGSVGRQLSNSAKLQQQEKLLKLRKEQIRAQYEQRIKMLRNQLNQEEAKKRLAIRNMDNQISLTRSAISAAKKKERINNKATKILSSLKNKFSSLKNK